MEETQQAARQLAETVLSGDKNRKGALVFALYGDLGSGKTSFTQGIGSALGVVEPVISPTFIIERVYAISKNEFKRFVHIDCYRFKESSEIEVLGWREMIKNPENIIVVEWAEKIEEYLPEDAVKIYFTHDDSGSGRIIESSK